MKTLIIGKGFIGDKVLDKLIDSGKHEEIDVFDLTLGHDLRNRTQVFEAIKGHDKVILMAAVANLNDFEADPLLGMDVNVGGLINVSNSCMVLKKKLYFISTCCVYGNTKDLPSSEEACVAPSEIYAAAKYAGEWILKGYRKSYDLDYVILRLATAYGPGMRAALAPAVFINQIKRREPITIHGSGEQTRTLTYIDDLVDGIVTVINSNVMNETFNISTEEERSVNELVDIIKQEMGVPDWKVRHTPDRKGQTFKEQIDSKKIREIRVWKGRYAPTAKKADEITGWKAKTTLKQGIKKTLEWMEKNKMKEI